MTTIPLNPFKLLLLILRFTLDAIVGTYRFVGGFLSSQWHSYNPLGQFLFVLALGALIIDAGVAASYGAKMTTLHAAGFAVVAIAFCVLPDVAFEEGRKGNVGGATCIGLASLFLGFVALQSHVGYGGGIRLTNMQQTGFQNAVASDARRSTESEEKNLETWRKSLAAKQDELASLKEAAGFVTSITADGLETELAALRERMAAEESGKRGRKAGRGAEFERLQNRATVISNQLGHVKRFNALSDEIKALEAEIKTTQAVVDAKAKTVRETGVASNVIVNQNDMVASMYNMLKKASFGGVSDEQIMQPSELERAIMNTLITGINSLGFLICGPILMIAAGLNRRRNVLRPDEHAHGEAYGDGEVTVPSTSLSDSYADVFATKYGIAA